MRHIEREAVARCSSCGGFFCRECVVDHAGRLVCASCLAKTSAASATSGRKRDLSRIRRAATLALSGLVLWMIFHAIGSLLLSMPADFHEGTVWRRSGVE